MNCSFVPCSAANPRLISSQLCCVIISHASGWLYTQFQIRCTFYIWDLRLITFQRPTFYACLGNCLLQKTVERLQRWQKTLLWKCTAVLSFPGSAWNHHWLTTTQLNCEGLSEPIQHWEQKQQSLWVWAFWVPCLSLSFSPLPHYCQLHAGHYVSLDHSNLSFNTIIFNFTISFFTCQTLSHKLCESWSSG